MRSRRLADKARTRNLEIGTVVAPVYPGTGGGSADGQRGGPRAVPRPGPQGVPRRAGGSANWAFGPTAWCGSTRPAASRHGREDPRRQPEADRRDVPRGLQDRRGSRRAAGRRGRNLLGRHAQLAADDCNCWRWSTARKRWVSRPTCRHSLLYLLGYNAPDDALLPQDFDWDDQASFDDAYAGPHRSAAAVDDRLPRGPERRHRARLRLARQDRPPLPGRRPERQARHRAATPAIGSATAAGRCPRDFRHICWDGCMFPNAVMMKRETWNDMLRAMVAVRDVHGWKERDR